MCCLDFTNRARTDPSRKTTIIVMDILKVQCNYVFFIGCHVISPQASSQFIDGQAPKSGYAKLRHLSDDTLLFQLTRTQSYKGLSCSLVALSHIGYRSVYY